MVPKARLVMNQPRSSLRIGLVISNFYPIVGGGERHAHSLARACARLGSQVIVVTRRRTAALPRKETMDGFTVIRLPPTEFPRLGKYFMILPVISAIWRLREELDLIYVCGLRTLGVAGVIAAALTKKPCVLRSESLGELSGDFIWVTPDGRHHFWRQLAFAPLIAARNRLLLHAQHFVAISSAIHNEYLSAQVPPRKISRIPNGIDLNAFYPVSAEQKSSIRATLGLPTSVRVFVYTGKLNRGKGLEMLLRAWKRVVAARDDTLLILVGSGKGQYLSCESALRHFVEENGLDAKVRITGYVHNVQDYLHAADVFVFPSESEAFGLAPLEAMACKLPVMASRIPAILDFITDGYNGWLINPHDEDAWFNALARFDPNSSETRCIAERAAAHARNGFNMDAIARQHLELFQRLFREYAGRPR